MMSKTGSSTSKEDEINLSIGRAEALILFEMLADLDRQRILEISDSAERLALVRLHGALEKTLVEPFLEDYLARVNEARSRLSSQYGHE
jgi:hypothetical protein